eukprot:1637529-Lingulodinium_polyedra.AAC.1
MEEGREAGTFWRKAVGDGYFGALPNTRLLRSMATVLTWPRAPSRQKAASSLRRMAVTPSHAANGVTSRSCRWIAY